MIKIVDRVQYLPKSPSNAIFDENAVRNMVVEQMINVVKEKANRAYRGPLPVTITVTGRVSKTSSKPTYDFKVSCEDPEVLEKIKKAIRG